MGKYKLVILRNENEKDYLPWEIACHMHQDKIDYRIVNLVADNWFEEISKQRFDYMILKPSGYVNKYKQLYDERLTILVKELHYSCYPTLEEVLIYENKRYFSFWLKANNIPHPKTFVSYSEKESRKFIKTTSLPLVAKLNIGASGKGVEILSSESEALSYVKDIFSGGKRSSTGPRLGKGNILQRVFIKLKDPQSIKERISTYQAIFNDRQQGFLIFQEYIPHSHEWRVVRIGDSYFAHKKLTKNSKASGSLAKLYGEPPLSLLDFVKDITDRHQFKSQAVDIFELDNDKYLVNEMQCIFGQSDSIQMMVNDVPGRYIHSNDKWIFEAGHFNENQSYNLRIEYLLQKLKES